MATDPGRDCGHIWPVGRQRWRRRAATAAMAAALTAVAAGCGAAEPGPPTLTWYINPDSGGQEEITRRCSEAAAGRYQIDVTLLPRESSEQRQQLIRRLAANDSSIDLMSLDPPYIPEFAEAGFLADVPDDVTARASKGVVDSALEGATWQDELVAIPFWANTQLLWYKKSVAAAAGLDMSQPATWEQLIEAAHLSRELDGHQLRAQAVVSIDAASRLREGQEAEFWLDSRKVHVFDPQSGENLTRDWEAGEELTRLAAEDRAQQLAEAGA